MSVSYQGYLRPHLGVIALRLAAGAKPLSIAKELYGSGARTLWSGTYQTPAAEMRAMAAMIWYIQRKDRPKPAKKRATQKAWVHVSDQWTPEKQEYEFQNEMGKR